MISSQGSCPIHLSETGPLSLAMPGTISSASGPFRVDLIVLVTGSAPFTSIRSTTSLAASHSPS